MIIQDISYVKQEQYFDEVIEEDEEATTKYAFIPE